MPPPDEEEAPGRIIGVDLQEARVPLRRQVLEHGHDLLDFPAICQIAGIFVQKPLRFLRCADLVILREERLRCQHEILGIKRLFRAGRLSSCAAAPY